MHDRLSPIGTCQLERIVGAVEGDGCHRKPLVPGYGTPKYRSTIRLYTADEDSTSQDEAYVKSRHCQPVYSESSHLHMKNVGGTNPDKAADLCLRRVYSENILLADPPIEEHEVDVSVDKSKRDPSDSILSPINSPHT
jgi:hypothetical protein